MRTPHESGSEESEGSNLTEAFDAEGMNASHRRSSTIREQRELESGSVHSDQESGNAPEPEIPPVRVDTRSRARKQLNPSRFQKFQREMRKLQMTPHFLIPRLPFGRVVREILHQYAQTSPLRITMVALEALQSAAEMYITQRLQDAYLLTIHRGRVTLENRDLALMAFITQQMGRL